MGELIVERRPSRSPQIGDLKSRISIYERTITAPNFGAEEVFTQAHTLIKTVWAKAETIKHYATFDGVNSEIKPTHKFSIRYRSDVVPNSIVKYDGNSYKVTKVDDTDLRKRFLFLLCQLLGDEDDQVNR